MALDDAEKMAMKSDAMPENMKYMIHLQPPLHVWKTTLPSFHLVMRH